MAKRIHEPWYRAQALAWVARFTDGDPVSIARRAARVALECDDAYKRSAVRAWEIAALTKRGCSVQAIAALSQAIEVAKNVQPLSSRAESLFILFQAGFAISEEQAGKVFQVLVDACPIDDHWRCKRAVRNAERMKNGEIEPHVFIL